MKQCKILLLVSALSTLFCVDWVFGEDRKRKNIEERLAGIERLLDTFTLSGFVRLRANTYNNFDLDKGNKEDNVNDFIDVRSYLSLKDEIANWSTVISIDIAGNDFNDGAILGYDNPGKNRPIEVDLQYAYIQYKKDFFFRVGRQPAKLGHRIVSNIVRDIGKLGWRFDRFSVTGVYVKGAEGTTQDFNPGAFSTTATSRRVLGASNGEDMDLDAFGLVISAPNLHENWLKVSLAMYSTAGLWPMAMALTAITIRG